MRLEHVQRGLVLLFVLICGADSHDGMLKRVEKADRNRDGKVTREEWRGPERMFKRLDKDGDGVISAGEKASFAAWKGKRGRRRGRSLEDTVWVKRPRPGQLPAGTKYETFYSSSMKHDVGCVVYIPPEYEKAAGPFPVIYFLHGIGGDELGTCRNSKYLREAIAAKAIRPCLAVYVNGAYSAFYCDSYDGKYMVETSIVKELIPHIEKRYRVIKSGDGRLIEGFSMGGHGALKIALKYPEMFCSVVTYAAALMNIRGFKATQPQEYRLLFNNRDDLYQENNPWELVRRNRARILESKLRLCLFAGSEDNVRFTNCRFHDLMKGLGIPHEYHEAEGVGHNMSQYGEAVGRKGYAFHESNLRRLLGKAVEPAGDDVTGLRVRE